MGNSARANPDQHDEEFDSNIGLLLGDTWWKLGKNFSKVLTVGDSVKIKNLDKWVEEVKAQLAKSGMNEPIGGITPKAVMTFVETVMRTLRDKFEGRDIAQSIRRLTKRANAFNVYDDGRYIDIQEPDDVFWAVEYDFLFSSLDKSLPGGGWLNAVARCADPDCNEFFIKSRTDQRHHTDACRTRSANRKSYAERTGSRSHTRRGRPRIRR